MIMDVSPTLIYTLLSTLFIAGTVWGVTKAALNGTRERVRSIELALRDHIKEETVADYDTHERLARLETKVDIILERIDGKRP